MTTPIGKSAAGGLGYQPALDGIRALAVAAVFAYHAGVGPARGGFVGVDVFFVLSGFLITSLLLVERHSTGRVSLCSFWVRRARRLLPALFILLLAMAAYAATLAPPDTLSSLRRSALATLLYVANWAQVTSGQGYFARLAAPDPLVHTWSLAIEEQFYVLWPLAVLGLARLGRGSHRLLLGACAAGAVASAGAMAFLYDGGAGVNRAYYGTDSRAQDLLVGAALAVFLHHRRTRSPGDRAGTLGQDGEAGTWAQDRKTGTAVPRLARGLAPLGLVAVGGAVVAARGTAGWMYEGGFLALSVVSAGLIAGVVLQPGSALARVLAVGPVRYLGRISYGVYLWHWPVIVVLDGNRTGLGRWDLLGLRAAATLALAVTSFHLVETPLRRPRPAAGSPTRRLGWLVGAGGVAACLVVSTVAPRGAQSAVDTLSAAPAGGPHLDAGVGSQLDPVPAGAAGPVRVLLVGDSMATTLAIGLGMGSESFGVQFRNDGVIGCGLVLPGLVTNRGITAPETGGLRDGRQWVRCDTWPQRWAADEARFHPDVTVMLEGAWEVRDRRIGGHWVHLGDRAFDDLELGSLRRAAQVLGSTGSRVVFLTSPYFGQPDRPDGSPQPADQPARVDRYNQLLRQVAGASRGRIAVVDLGARVCPRGRFQMTVGGVNVRAGDGLHFTTAGDAWLQPWLLPILRTTGQEARRTAD